VRGLEAIKPNRVPWGLNFNGKICVVLVVIIPKALHAFKYKVSFKKSTYNDLNSACARVLLSCAAAHMYIFHMHKCFENYLDQ
jgi:hypothetical protein